jgi:hypothetical protein
MYNYVETPTHDLGKALKRAQRFSIRYNHGDNAYDLYRGNSEIVFSGLTRDEAEDKYVQMNEFAELQEKR